MQKILVIGHSHLNAIDRAVKTAATESAIPKGIALRCIRLTGKTFRPPLIRTEGAWYLNKAIVDLLTRHRWDFVVSCIGGNGHNVVGLLNHPIKFDFVLPSCPELPIAEGHEILPSMLVTGILRRQVGPNLRLLAAVRDAFKGPMIHLESPPPVPSEEHIRSNPSSFKDRIDRFGVSPALLRYKLWRVHSAIYRQECRRLGIRFLPVPRKTQDAQGMLVKAAWNVDPTHGNTWYGLRVLRQLAYLRLEKLKIAS